MVFCLLRWRGKESSEARARGSGSMDTLLGLLGICGANCAEDRDPETKGRSGGVVSECRGACCYARGLQRVSFGFTYIFVQPPPPARCTSQGREKAGLMRR